MGVFLQIRVLGRHRRVLGWALLLPQHCCVKAIGGPTSRHGVVKWCHLCVHLMTAWLGSSLLIVTAQLESICLPVPGVAEVPSSAQEMVLSTFLSLWVCSPLGHVGSRIHVLQILERQCGAWTVHYIPCPHAE